VRDSREERVGSLVDRGHAGERRRLELAPEPVVPLADLDLDGVGGDQAGEGAGGGEATDPAADDDHPGRWRRHWSSLYQCE
jgi:hypothetical protein